MARAYQAIGDGANALAQFNRALALAPNDSAVWVDLARFRRANGDLGGALQAADRAVALRPGNTDALVLRGELTRGQYGLAAALPWFNRALEIDRNNLAALLGRAATYGDMGRMRDMLADAGEHVLQRLALEVMIEDVVHRDERNAGGPRERDAGRQPRAVVAAIKHRGGEPHAAGRGIAQAMERFRNARRAACADLLPQGGR